jgi:hypothetical protein
LPQSRACNFKKNGQVAMTTIAAQISGDKNGRTTQKQAAMRMPMNSTARVVRVRLGESGLGESEFIFAGEIMAFPATRSSAGSHPLPS